MQVYGQHWHVSEELGRLIFQDECGLLDLLPNLPGASNSNAGTALAALRVFVELQESACEAAIRNRNGRRAKGCAKGLPALAPGAELWLDGGITGRWGRACPIFSKPAQAAHLFDLRNAKHERYQRVSVAFTRGQRNAIFGFDSK